jgi:4-methyl-5(b-hydroxyethyl)-thiazole monophosphate biosynthesis
MLIYHEQMKEMSTKKVLLFLARGFEDLEAAAIIDLCGWTYYREHLQKVDVTVTGFHRDVTGRFGLTINTDVLIDDINFKEYDALAIPGGFHSNGFDEAYDDKVLNLAAAIHDNGGIIATMCVGILPVAKAGLLAGKKATTYPFSSNHDNPRYLREHGCRYTGKSIENDGRIISCAGPCQSLQVVMILLEMLLGAVEIKKIKELTLFEK